MVVLQIRTRKSFQRSRNTFKVIKRNENEDQITGHLPDSQAEKTTPLMRRAPSKPLNLKEMLHHGEYGHKFVVYKEI